MADADELKKKRALAKGLFTKAQKSLRRVMEKKSDLEIIESRMSDVKRTYHEAQEKHQEYMNILNLDEEDDAFAQEDEWISKVEDEYDAIEEEKIAYVRNKEKESGAGKKGSEGKVDEKPAGASQSDQEKQLKSMREVELQAFNTIHTSVKEKIEKQMKSDEPILDIVKEELSDLKRQYEACKQIHQKYIVTLVSIPEPDIKWASNLQERVTKISSSVSNLLQKKEDVKRGGISHEKLKMPTFDGKIRDYPRFKADFERQILPKYKRDTYGAAYALKSCLSGEPLSIVRNVDDDHDEMWKRLDQKYGDKSRVIDTIMTEIKNLTHVNNANSQEFIQLITTIENGYRDLERLKLESEIANSTAISIIEDKLPNDIRRLWALEISKSNIPSEKKFDMLLKFLLDHRRAIEYDVDNIRARQNMSSTSYGSVNMLDNNQIIDMNNNYQPQQLQQMTYYSNSNHNQPASHQYSGSQPNQFANQSMYHNSYNHIPNSNNPQYAIQGGASYFQRNMPLPPPPPRIRATNVQFQVCCIHKSPTHSTADCRDYLGMDAMQKIDVVKNNGLCYSCLIAGHRSFHCKTRKKCGINQCNKFHHSSLHQGSIEGLGFHTLGFPSSSTCLLQIMMIRTIYENIKQLNVFFDGGATISLITFHIASKLGLQGKEITLSVTKVGGVKEKLKSFMYILELLDQNNVKVEFQVYGIDKITTELESINIQGVLHLFKNAKSNELKRPTGEVDVLIGYEYAGYHPVARQKSGHLLLLSNRFGKCLGGSHPLLSENTQKIIEHVNIHHIEGEITVEDFYSIESMGVNCNPKCGSCSCGHCSIGSKDL